MGGNPGSQDVRRTEQGELPEQPGFSLRRNFVNCSPFKINSTCRCFEIL